MPLWLGVGAVLLAAGAWILGSVGFKGESRVSVSPTDIQGSGQVSISRQPAGTPVDTAASVAPQLAASADQLDFGKSYNFV